MHIFASSPSSGLPLWIHGLNCMCGQKLVLPTGLAASPPKASYKWPPSASSFGCSSVLVKEEQFCFTGGPARVLVAWLQSAGLLGRAKTYAGITRLAAERQQDWLPLLTTPGTTATGVADSWKWPQNPAIRRQQIGEFVFKREENVMATKEQWRKYTW